jgi:hypothetical protein
MFRRNRFLAEEDIRGKGAHLGEDGLSQATWLTVRIALMDAHFFQPHGEHIAVENVEPLPLESGVAKPNQKQLAMLEQMVP